MFLTNIIPYRFQNNYVDEEQVEILAIALGRKIENKIEIEELIFPLQDGNTDQVVDKGNVNCDTQSF